MRTLVALLAVLIFLVPKAADAAPCRLALVLALDVSGSVNETEYRQQLNGLAYALDSVDVRAAVLGAGATVDLAVFEWSSRNHQFMVVPWATLDSPAAIDRAVARILEYRKQRAGLKTALSTALLFAATLLEERRHCWQHTIDVSGDGENNIGPSLRQVYGSGILSDVTVNALVVGDPADAGADRSHAMSRHELVLYFQRNVIRGAGAFTMLAQGYEDYERAMKLKLLREMAVPEIGAR